MPKFFISSSKHLSRSALYSRVAQPSSLNDLRMTLCCKSIDKKVNHYMLYQQYNCTNAEDVPYSIFKAYGK